jgi:tRNA(adenine34) deaminase
MFQVKEYRMTSESSRKTAKKKTTKKKWVSKFTTDSTHPPHEMFTKSAPVIARSLASKKVSPKGVASGMRMLTYYINRAGKTLSASHKEELEKAKQLLSKKIKQQKEAT